VPVFLLGEVFTAGVGCRNGVCCVFGVGLLGVGVAV